MAITHPPSQYLPARLVKGKQAWYIIFYQTNPDTGRKERHRQKLGINRIPDNDAREEHARLILKEINDQLPFGYPHNQEGKELERTPVKDAIEKALRIKQFDNSRKSKKTFESIAGIFIDYLQANRLHGQPVADFSHLDAVRFMDYVLEERQVGACTYNNYKRILSNLFNELARRQYVTDNPFSGISKLKSKPKTRRAFNSFEKRIVGEAIWRKDKTLFLATMLQYYCFVRPGSEMLRLRAWHFDLEEGLISLPGDISKNGKSSTVTIPDILIGFVRKMLDGIPSNYIIFGRGARPHPKQPCGVNTLYERHKQILNQLKKNGALNDTTGLTFYSWKDTGALELFRKKVNILEIMRQLRHADLSTTQRYCQSLYAVNQEIKTQVNVGEFEYLINLK